MSFESKTLQLIEKYHRIVEADELPPGASPEDMGGDVQDVTEAPPEQTQAAPLTSQGELDYIEKLVDAALFKPNAEEANMLEGFQRTLQTKDPATDPRSIADAVKVMVEPKEKGNDLVNNLDIISQ
jgi:hypothetical protein